ncbi:MAG TPA: EAL domain-containing protein [Nocardioidaceae bacterium]|nr:EAL domain-containing protein [Nocardioidaceae bacterium]
MEDDLTARRLSLLGDIRSMLAATVDDFVERFYDDLSDRQGPAEVLARLSETERKRLKSHQAEHLLFVLDPDLDEQAAYARARQVGRVHSMVGVEIEWYAAAMSSHHQQIFDLVGSIPDSGEQAWLYSAVAQRLMRDLQAALAGYRDVDAAQHRAMMRVNQAVTTAGTVPDLVRGVLSACEAAEGIAAGFFGRPDQAEVFQFEMGVGAGAEEFMAEVARREPLTITVLRDEASGQGPSGRSWRSGAVERSDSYLNDPTTAPWHDLGERLGWRSSVSVPISDSLGEPRALLSFYSYWPGFFATPARQGMLLQVKHLVERALAALDARGTVASGVRAYSARTSYLARLHAGEVEMLFQPIVELRTGQVYKVEALARLVGDYRLVLPAEFLPAYGDEELVRLFELGLDQSLRGMRTWSEQGLDIGVSLNLPAVSSQDERYVALVERALTVHRAEPSRLTLELLETGYDAGRPRWRSQVLDQLKSLGVRLAQDDLGSGYSSLLRLRHFAFDDVKLDQSLIRGEEFDPRGALNFIHPLTSLAHSMGLHVIVEGLENDGLIEAAYMLGADAGQGYGISRPLHSRDVPAWAKSFHLDIDHHSPTTRLGGLAAHVAWEHRVSAIATGAMAVPQVEEPCPLDGYIHRLGDPGGHLSEAHAAVHRASHEGRGSTEHLRWWRVLTRMLGGLSV